jgi:hypothetical protein
MRKKEKKLAENKLKVIISTDGIDGFFKRGKAIAKLADEGKPIPPKLIINFDSPEEMMGHSWGTPRFVL